MSDFKSGTCECCGNDRICKFCGKDRIVRAQTIYAEPVITMIYSDGSKYTFNGFGISYCLNCGKIANEQGYPRTDKDDQIGGIEIKEEI